MIAFESWTEWLTEHKKATLPMAGDEPSTLIFMCCERSMESHLEPRRPLALPSQKPTSGKPMVSRE